MSQRSLKTAPSSGGTRLPVVESGYRAKEKKSKIFPRGVRRLERSTGLSMLIAGYRQSEHGGLTVYIYVMYSKCYIDVLDEV